MDIRMKKIGIIFTIIGTILMIFIIFITIMIYQNFADDSKVMFSNAYYYMIAGNVLCFVVGIFCLVHKQLKKWSELIKTRLNTKRTRDIKITPKKQELPKQKARNSISNQLKPPSVPEQISRSQFIQSLYLCEKIHPFVVINFFLGIVIMVGTLASIPFFAERMQPNYELLYVTIAVVLFWSGVFISIGAKGKIKLQRTTGFGITMDGFLYCLSINPSIYESHGRPYTKIGRIIHDSKKLKKINEAERTVETFLNSKEAIKEIEACINENQVQDFFVITRMDAPHISRRNVSSIQIKFWNAKCNRVEKITLFKSNKGFEQIIHTVNKLDQNINYRKLKID